MSRYVKNWEALEMIWSLGSPPRLRNISRIPFPTYPSREAPRPERLRRVPGEGGGRKSLFFFLVLPTPLVLRYFKFMIFCGPQTVGPQSAIFCKTNKDRNDCSSHSWAFFCKVCASCMSCRAAGLLVLMPLLFQQGRDSKANAKILRCSSSFLHITCKLARPVRMVCRRCFSQRKS